MIPDLHDLHAQADIVSQVLKVHDLGATRRRRLPSELGPAH